MMYITYNGAKPGPSYDDSRQPYLLSYFGLKEAFPTCCREAHAYCPGAHVPHYCSMLIPVALFAPEAWPRKGYRATSLVGFTHNYDISQCSTKGDIL